MYGWKIHYTKALFFSEMCSKKYVSQIKKCAYIAKYSMGGFRSSSWLFAKEPIFKV